MIIDYEFVKEIAELAYDIHEHGESFERRDKLRKLLKEMGYKFPDYD